MPLASALLDLGSTSAASLATLTHAAIAHRRAFGLLSRGCIAFALLDLGSTSACSLAKLSDAALAQHRALGLHSRGSHALALLGLGSTTAGSRAKLTDVALALRHTVGLLSLGCGSQSPCWTSARPRLPRSLSSLMLRSLYAAHCRPAQP